MTTKFVVFVCLVAFLGRAAATPCFGDKGATELVCEDGNFAGLTTFPEDIGEYTQLTAILILDTQKLVGQIPSEIGLLTQLVEVDITNTGISGTLPSEIGALTNLETFSVVSPVGSPKPTGIGLHGTIPSQLGSLVKLNSLVLRGQHLRGTIPGTLSNLKEVSTLDMSFNRLTGTFPDALEQLPKLTWLFLENNKLNGKLAASLFGLPSLTNLKLNDNKFTGTLPGGVIPKKLVELHISDCELEGTIPDGFLLNPGLERSLVLSRNKLSGTLPPDMSWFNEIDLAFNQFTGTIPSSIGSSLLRLSLNDNKLSGTIPTELSVVSNMLKLKLENNDLTGSLPDSFRLDSTAELSMYNNALNGTLPLWVENINNPIKAFPNNFEGPLRGNAGHIQYCRDTRCSKAFALTTISNVSGTGEACNNSTRCTSSRGIEQICALNNICCEPGSPRSCIECEPDTGRCLTPELEVVAGNNSKPFVQPIALYVESLSSGMTLAVWIWMLVASISILITMIFTCLRIKKLKLE